MARENGHMINDNISESSRKTLHASCKEQKGEDHRPRCSQHHVLKCQFGEWYPVFKHCTPRSVVLDLPEDVVQYLQEDGVVLPQGFGMSCGEGIGDHHDDEVDWDEDEDEDVERPDFPELHERLMNAIRDLGGKVFPKLNWSCPKDAAWVNGGTLKCSTPGDVICLLKSSTFISHDLGHAFDLCVDATVSRPETFTVVLRKWCNLHPSMLFRCFVRGRRLVGVCQRDCTSYYGFLKEEYERIAELLDIFFAGEVCKKFPDPECVADVYVDSRSRVWLLDINPFSTVTDSLLFDWAEDALAAPLMASSTGQDEEEKLPPDVFLRLHIRKSDESHSVWGSETSPRTPSNGVDTDEKSQGGHGEEVSHLGFSLGTRDKFDFDFRIIPSELHLVPDPMARYRGPADVDMGTLVGGISGGSGVEQLVQTCRVEAKSGEERSSTRSSTRKRSSSSPREQYPSPAPEIRRLRGGWWRMVRITYYPL